MFECERETEGEGEGGRGAVGGVRKRGRDRWAVIYKPREGLFVQNKSALIQLLLFSYFLSSFL